MPTLHFTLGSNICMQRMNGEEFEIEVGPERYRALYDLNHRGEVTRIAFEVHDARPAKEDRWKPTSLSYHDTRAIEREIEEDFCREQRRIMGMYEESIA